MRTIVPGLAPAVAVLACASAGAGLASCAPASVDDPAGESEDEDEDEDEGEDEGERVLVDEREPNGGDPVTATNPLAVAGGARGVIDGPDDVDVFAVASTPGHVYRVGCATSGSPLDCHLTVLDDGRSGDAAGDDYVRLAAHPDGPDAALTFVALGQGGHYVIVRDARALAGAGRGGADFGYVVTMDDVTGEPGLSGPALAFPGSHDGALPSPASLQLHPLDAVEGADVVIDVAAAGDADLRAFVVSAATGDWVLRNDDRGADSDPLIDAFFPAAGPHLLLVEAVADDASDVRYTVTTSGNAR
jgi:hypothetical protein